MDNDIKALFSLEKLIFRCNRLFSTVVWISTKGKSTGLERICEMSWRIKVKIEFWYNMGNSVKFPNRYETFSFQPWPKKKQKMLIIIGAEIDVWWKGTKESYWITQSRSSILSTQEQKEKLQKNTNFPSQKFLFLASKSSGNINHWNAIYQGEIYEFLSGRSQDECGFNFLQMTCGLKILSPSLAITKNWAFRDINWHYSHENFYRAERKKRKSFWFAQGR